MSEDIEPLQLALGHLEAAIDELGGAEAWLWDQGYTEVAVECQDASGAAESAKAKLEKILRQT